jgi:hypothetical protein
MLFDPHAFTGHPNDPTVPEEERRGAIRGALKLGAENKVEYGVNKVPQGKQEGYDKAIENAGHVSGIPTHMFKDDVNVPTIVKKSLGRNTGGDYHALGGRHAIRVREGFSWNKPVLSSEEVTEPVVKKGRTLINPTGVDMLKKDHANTYSGGKGRISAPDYDYWNSVKDRVSRNGLVRDQNGEASREDLDNLPEGHGVTLFPGKGKETDEYTVHPVKVQVGHTDRWNASMKTYHRRVEKVPTGETRTYTKKTFDETPTISSGTLVHEVGHSIDPNVGVRGGYNRSGADTVKEATADGFEDRFHLHKDNYEEALHPSPERAAEMKVHGYTVKSDRVADNDINKALYAAVRQHVSMGDKNFKDVEDRNNLSWQAHNQPMGHGGVSEGNTLLLGHLYSKHAHVRDILGHLKLSHVGEAAAEHYRSKITDAGRGNNLKELYEKGRGFNKDSTPASQPTLPGME